MEPALAEFSAPKEQPYQNCALHVTETNHSYLLASWSKFKASKHHISGRSLKIYLGEVRSNTLSFSDQDFDSRFWMQDLACEIWRDCFVDFAMKGHATTLCPLNCFFLPMIVRSAMKILIYCTGPDFIGCIAKGSHLSSESQFRDAWVGIEWQSWRDAWLWCQSVYHCILIVFFLAWYSMYLAGSSLSLSEPLSVFKSLDFLCLQYWVIPIPQRIHQAGTSKPPMSSISICSSISDRPVNIWTDSLTLSLLAILSQQFSNFTYWNSTMYLKVYSRCSLLGKMQN